MTLYNPIKDTSPANPAIQTDNGSYVFGLYFKVTANYNLNGVWWYCDVANGQYTNSSADEKIGLWSTIGGGGGSYVGAVETTAGTYVQGWNLISFSSPVALTAGQEYCAVKSISSSHGGSNSLNYCAISNFFGAIGNAGTAGFPDGPALVYSSGSVATPGTANQEPNSNGQQGFFSSSSNSPPPALAGNFPSGSFHATWYGMDVQIATTPAPSGSGLLMASFP